MLVVGEEWMDIYCFYKPFRYLLSCLYSLREKYTEIVGALSGFCDVL